MRDILTEYAKGERNFRGAGLYGADLRRANLYGANLHGANLRSANLRAADLYGANLCCANLYGANLCRANLHGANLNGANLNGANLHGADLSRANLRAADLGSQWIIQGPIRSDGYAFFFMRLTQHAEPRIIAGCRDFSLQDAHKHWQTTRAGTALGAETFAILDCLEAMAKARGLS